MIYNFIHTETTICHLKNHYIHNAYVAMILIYCCTRITKFSYIQFWQKKQTNKKNVVVPQSCMTKQRIYLTIIVSRHN